MNKPYQDIRTLSELDAAIARNSKQLSRKGDLLNRGLKAARKFYSPSGLLPAGLRQGGSSLSLAGVLLSLLSRRLRRDRKSKK